VDDGYIKRLAAEATHHQKLGLKLPGSAMSTAPKETNQIFKTSLSVISS